MRTHWIVLALLLAIFCVPASGSAEEAALQSDFQALYERNPEIVGWLAVEKVCDLPVVYRDNEFYMDHDYYGNESVAGTLFMDERNTLFPADTNLLLYGHNMKDGTMFGLLRRYRDLANVRTEPTFTYRTIYDETPTEYVIVSVFDASMNHGDPEYFPLIRLSFDEAGFQQFAADLDAWSLFDCPVTIEPTDKLITLVTCSYTNDNGRLLVFARALREGETTSDAAAYWAQATEK